MGFENTWTVSFYLQVKCTQGCSRLYGWGYKTLKTTPIISSTAVSHQGDSHSAGSQSVVITVGS